jgi:glycosyltransferase involved in cell wall biosynthesis
MKNKINILHIRASEGGGGGPEKTIFNTARQIDTRRFWYGTCYLRKHRSDLTAVATRYREKGLPYFEVAGGIFDLRQLQEISGLIQRHHVHILHTHDAKTIIYGVLLKVRFPQMKLVTTLHGWVMRRRRSRFYQWCSEFGLRIHDAVIAVSDDLKRKTRQKGIHRVVRIYNAIDPDDWPLIFESGKNNRHAFTVGFIGRISREKGPEQFLDVARILSAVDEEIRFRMIGEGPLAEWVKTEITRLGLDRHFSLDGHVPQGHMPEIYAKIDVLLSSSHTEGMPNTLLEAFACGIPVVATRVGGVEELISDGDDGFLVTDGDRVALARNTLKLKYHSDLSRQFSRYGREKILERFTFVKRVRAMENLYETLITRGCL